MNKNEWDNSLMEHFAPKKAGLSLDLLMEMVKEVMDSSGTLLSEAEERSMEDLYKFLPQFEFSEMIGRPEDADIANKSEVRSTFTSMMSGIAPGAGLQEKIDYVNKFVSAAGEATTAVDILRNLTFLRLLSVVVQDFTDAGAGFIFEAFLAGLLGGAQVSSRGGEETHGSLPIHDYMDGDGKPVSLKLLGPNTPIGGSMYNITRFLATNQLGVEHGIRYVVAIKFDDEKLGFYEFTITRENYFSWLQKFINLDAIDISPALKSSPEELSEAEADPRIEKLSNQVAAFREKIISLMPMLGFTLEDARNKLEDKDTASSFTSGLGTLYHKFNPALMQSEEGQKAFEEFLSLSGASPTKKTTLAAGADPNEVRKARYALLKIAMTKLSEDNVLSIRPMQKLSNLTDKTTKAPVGEKIKVLNDLAKTNPELWGKIILKNHKKAFVHSQFELNQAKSLSRSETTNYGNLVIGKSQVLKVMNNYGTVLRNEIMPIYEQLYNITRAINSFFVEGDLTASSRAETAGNKLEVQTNTLASNTTEK